MVRLPRIRDAGRPGFVWPSPQVAPHCRSVARATRKGGRRSGGRTRAAAFVGVPGREGRGYRSPGRAGLPWGYCPHAPEFGGHSTYAEITFTATTNTVCHAPGGPWEPVARSPRLHGGAPARPLPSRYRDSSQCVGLQSGGAANLMAATWSVAGSRPAEPDDVFLTRGTERREAGPGGGRAMLTRAGSAVRPKTVPHSGTATDGKARILGLSARGASQPVQPFRPDASVAQAVASPASFTAIIWV